MRRYFVLIAGLALGLWLASPAFAQAKLTASFKRLSRGSLHQEYQLFRIDNSASISGTDSPESGETGVVAGSWSEAVNAHDYQEVTFYVFEYGTGSIDVTLYDCIKPAGQDLPDSQDPATAPTPADPDPLCVDLANSAQVTIIGTSPGVQFFAPESRRFSWLVARIDACVQGGGTFCDAQVILLLGKRP